MTITARTDWKASKDRIQQPQSQLDKEFEQTYLQSSKTKKRTTTTTVGEGVRANALSGRLCSRATCWEDRLARGQDTGWRVLIIEYDMCHGGEHGYYDDDNGALVDDHGEVNMSLVMVMMISSVMIAPSLVSLVSKRWLEAIQSQARPNIFRSWGFDAYWFTFGRSLWRWHIVAHINWGNYISLLNIPSYGDWRGVFQKENFRTPKIYIFRVILIGFHPYEIQSVSIIDTFGSSQDRENTLVA